MLQLISGIRDDVSGNILGHNSCGHQPMYILFSKSTMLIESSQKLHRV